MRKAQEILEPVQEVTEPIKEVLEAEPEPPEPEPPKPPEPEPVIEETKLRQVLNLVQCEKCTRKMTEKSLQYSHESICPANRKQEDIVKKHKRTNKVLKGKKSIHQ